jgi:undecaprenyl-diphosphatase
MNGDARTINWKVPAILVGLVVLLGLLAKAGMTAWLDVPILKMLALREATSPAALIAFAKFFTWMGDGQTRIVICALCAALLVWRKMNWQAVAVIVTPAIAGISSTLLKLSFGRARPDLTPHLDAVHDLSFPSGHATSGTATFLILAMMAPPEWRARLLTPATAIATLICLSRPMLGVHWPTDVMGGAMLGTAWALIGADFVNRKQEKPAWQADLTGLS